MVHTQAARQQFLFYGSVGTFFVSLFQLQFNVKKKKKKFTESRRLSQTGKDLKRQSRIIPNTFSQQKILQISVSLSLEQMWKGQISGLCDGGVGGERVPLFLLLSTVHWIWISPHVDQRWQRTDQTLTFFLTENHTHKAHPRNVCKPKKKKKKIQSNFFLYVPHKEKWVWPRKRRGPLCANLANYRPLMDHILRCTCYSLLVGRPTFLATCPPRVNPFVEHNILIWSKIDGLVRGLDWRWPKSPDDNRCQHLVQQAAGV